jgi:hypothetical protein
VSAVITGSPKRSNPLLSPLLSCAHYQDAPPFGAESPLFVPVRARRATELCRSEWVQRGLKKVEIFRNAVRTRPERARDQLVYLVAVPRCQPLVRFSRPLVGRGRGVTSEHLTRPPPCYLHKIPLAATLGEPFVGELVTELVWV